MVDSRSPTTDSESYVDRPAWTGILACLPLFAMVTFVVLFMVASFTQKPKADGSVAFEDEANILSPEAKAAITQTKFPEDIPVVVRTVSAIPKDKMGSFASDLMSEDRHWQTLRPRGWLRRNIMQQSPSGSGVYVLVSLDPQLLQIRFGSEIRLSAYENMVAIGPWYRDQQLFERNALDEHLI